MKLLNILTVMLLLTRTVAAAEGAVSSDPMAADRQWLKQQEDFSEQLRRQPDKALQQELEAQISRNPLTRSDQQFIDNLASQQRSRPGINRRKVLCIASPSQYRTRG